VDDLTRWSAAIRGAGGTAAPADVRAAGRELLTRWAEPHRHYHTVAHLRAVLDEVDALGGSPVVRLAAWWHDAVYDPRAPGDANERTSADLAARTLAGLGVPAPARDEVARLVLVTADHAPGPGDRAGGLLCDADLAVLAAPPRAYDAYAEAVRREYAHLPDEAFRAGRAAVLRRLLTLPALYRTAVADREARARANLSRELRHLTTPG
jgi:predicted metal-dependent HD superfamily phosphohydrolase